MPKKNEAYACPFYLFYIFALHNSRENLFRKIKHNNNEYEKESDGGVRHPDAGVYVFIDAADNAKMAAQDSLHKKGMRQLITSAIWSGGCAGGQTYPVVEQSRNINW